MIPTTAVQASKGGDGYRNVGIHTTTVYCFGPTRAVILASSSSSSTYACLTGPENEVHGSILPVTLGHRKQLPPQAMRFFRVVISHASEVEHRNGKVQGISRRVTLVRVREIKQ